MYHPLIDTFFVVIECGSFTKAAEKLFISPTAVMKQMNSLEQHLNLQLIERTSVGIRLTPSGEIIYRNAQFLIEYANKTIAAAKAKEKKYQTTFCVGTSLLNPAKPFMDLWYQVSHEFPDYRLHLVPFEDNHSGILAEIQQLGEKFDFLIGVCDSRAWMSHCRFLPLGTYRKMIAVSRDHRLAQYKRIAITDLYGETLMMVKEGDSEINDFIRNEITLHHPQIKLEDTPQFYDISVFNRCAETQRVLLTIECWKDVHPGIVTIPVQWRYRIPYGLLYSRDADEDILKFVNAAEKRMIIDKKQREV